MVLSFEGGWVQIGGRVVEGVLCGAELEMFVTPPMSTAQKALTHALGIWDWDFLGTRFYTKITL